MVIARAIAGDSGLLTVATVVPEETDTLERSNVDATRATIEHYLESHAVSALVKVDSDADMADGLISLVKSYGFGPLVPNTVLLGQALTPDDPLKHAELLTLITPPAQPAHPARRRGPADSSAGAAYRRLVARDQGNVGLMLALAFLLTEHLVAAADAKNYQSLSRSSPPRPPPPRSQSATPQSAVPKRQPPPSEWSLEKRLWRRSAIDTEAPASRNQFNDFPPQNASRYEPVNVGI